MGHAVSGTEHDSVTGRTLQTSDLHKQFEPEKGRRCLLQRKSLSDNICHWELLIHATATEMVCTDCTLFKSVWAVSEMGTNHLEV